MKKTILFLVILALAAPTAALAATEFSLGGFIKLDTFWDSSQEGKNMNGPIARNNDPNFHHGHAKFTAQGSRFSFTIKGPKLWGAQTTGFIEMDFDAVEEGATGSFTDANRPNVAFTSRGAGTTASNSYSPRLRHAMFRLNWPETELLMGQYWSMLCEWWPEVAQDGPFQMSGIPTARIPQIRVTQNFAGAWTVAALIGDANAAAGNRTFSLLDRNGGESSEMPQIQAKVAFQQDLWGKAAYYGKPTPFTAQLAAGVQRNDFGARNFTSNQAGAGAATVGTDNRLLSFSDNGYARINARTNNTYEYPWIVMGTLFIPVIPTYSANLAGTASLMTQWWIGQGVEAFGFAGISSNVYRMNGSADPVTGLEFASVELMKRFGGYIQGQYYFNNQWFLTAAYAMSKAFGVSAGETDDTVGANTSGQHRAYALAADTQNYVHEFNLCLWYRPIQAIKFGLQYAYVRSNYFQRSGINAAGAVSQGDVANSNDLTNYSKFGDAHRVEFVGFFYF